MFHVSPVKGCSVCRVRNMEEGIITVWFRARHVGYSVWYLFRTVRLRIVTLIRPGKNGMSIQGVLN